MQVSPVLYECLLRQIRAVCMANECHANNTTYSPDIDFEFNDICFTHWWWKRTYLRRLNGYFSVFNLCLFSLDICIQYTRTSVEIRVASVCDVAAETCSARWCTQIIPKYQMNVVNVPCENINIFKTQINRSALECARMSYILYTMCFTYVCYRCCGLRVVYTLTWMVLMFQRAMYLVNCRKVDIFLYTIFFLAW